MTYDLIEKKTLELKQAFSPSFLKTVSAFANYGDGEIIFGVSDDGNVVGVDNMMELKLKIENSINDAIEPRPNFSFEEISLSDKNVLVLKVFRGDSQPYYYKSKAYQRMDTASVPIDRLALQKLVMVETQKDFDEMPSKHIELEFKTLSKWMNNVLGVQSLTEDVLISIGLLDRGQFNNAAELFADNNHIKNSRVDMVRYGDNISIFLDRKTINQQSILKQYEEAVEYFRQWYKPYLAVDGMPRKERIQIPEIAFLEVMANALIHRDYLINGAIQVEMYKDKVIVHSQGGLPEGITEDDYLNKNISIPRNAILADVFHRLKLIERFGTGVRRIKFSYDGFLEEPVFEISQHLLTITLPCVTYQDEVTDSNQHDNLTDQGKIMKAVREKKRVTRRQVQSITGLGESQSKVLLNRLIEMGLLKRVGKGRSTEYELNE